MERGEPMGSREVEGIMKVKTEPTRLCIGVDQCGSDSRYSKDQIILCSDRDRV